MKIQNLTGLELKNVIDLVDQALAVKATKSNIVKTLAAKGFCSPKSAGFENTLLSLAAQCNYIPANLAKVMGVPVRPAGTFPTSGLPSVPPTQVTRTTAPAAPSVARPLAEQMVVALNLVAASMLTFHPNGSLLVHFRDGSTAQTRGFGVSDLKRSSTVFEFRG